MRAIRKKHSSSSSSDNSSSSHSGHTKEQTRVHKQPQFFNNPTNYQPQKADIPQSDSEEDSSEYEPKQAWKKQGQDAALSAKKQLLSESEEQDKSIDQIEERIKRLEKDLEERIGKHKQQKGKVQKSSETGGSKIVGSLQMAKMGEQKLEREKKVMKDNNKVIAAETKINIAQLKVPKSGKSNEESKRKLEQAKQPKAATPKKQQVAKGKGERRPDKKPKTQSRKTEESSKMPIRVVSAKQRAESKQARKDYEKMEKTDLLRQLAEAHQQIEEMQRTIDQLSYENRQLKEQGSSKKRIKSSEQYERLRQITGSDKAKLEKELQLLKIIESLQSKLKKSVARKLKHSEVPSVLLHKGLPSSHLD